MMGEKHYDHHHEGGKHVASDMELGHCGARLRNLRTPTLLKVKYEKQTLTIETKAEDDEHWTHCVQVVFFVQLFFIKEIDSIFSFLIRLIPLLILE